MEQCQCIIMQTCITCKRKILKKWTFGNNLSLLIHVSSDLCHKKMLLESLNHLISFFFSIKSNVKVAKKVCPWIKRQRTVCRYSITLKIIILIRFKSKQVLLNTCALLSIIWVNISQYQTRNHADWSTESLRRIQITLNEEV